MEQLVLMTKLQLIQNYNLQVLMTQLCHAQLQGAPKADAEAIKAGLATGLKSSHKMLRETLEKMDVADKDKMVTAELMKALESIPKAPIGFKP